MLYHRCVKLTVLLCRLQSLSILSVGIAKFNGKTRPLGIPTIKERIVQITTKLVKKAKSEADFKECLHGIRP